METAFTYALLLFLGLMFGSFAGAQVWRLRSRQLLVDKEQGEEVDESEYEALRPLAASTFMSDRSRCLACGHTLAWYDLLPLISWISTAGKCRYCKQPIGRFEPFMEIGVAALFAASYYFWPLPMTGAIDVSLFVLWLVAIVLLTILFAYDKKWFLLPDQIVFTLIGVGAIMSALRVATGPDMAGALLSIVGAIVVLSGLYLFLWLISGGKWIGFGDVKLGLGLALLLADWQLALLALFTANFIGSVMVLPGMIRGTIDRKTQVPFGPLLIAGTVIAMLAGEDIIALYLGLVF